MPDVESLVAAIEKHGFLSESLAILSIYAAGKQASRSFGRSHVRRELRDKGIHLSQQQLRLRLERLDRMGLLRVRLGRAGTTISRHGEQFLRAMHTHGES